MLTNIIDRVSCSQKISLSIAFPKFSVVSKKDMFQHQGQVFFISFNNSKDLTMKMKSGGIYLHLCLVTVSLIIILTHSCEPLVLNDISSAFSEYLCKAAKPSLEPLGLTWNQQQQGRKIMSSTIQLQEFITAIMFYCYKFVVYPPWN